MILIAYSCKYVRPNHKLFHNFKNIRLLNRRRSFCFSINSTIKIHTKSVDNSKNNESKSDAPSPTENKSKTKEYPEEPTTCCMAGCANCVWLDYAEKLSEYYRDGGERAIQEINEKVTDPNIKAYLLHELRMRKKN